MVHPILGSGNAIICGLCTIYCYGRGPGQHLPTLSKRFARDLEGLLLKVSTQIPNNVENIKIYQSFSTLFLFERILRKLHMTFTFI